MIVERSSRAVSRATTQPVSVRPNMTAASWPGKKTPEKRMKTGSLAPQAMKGTVNSVAIFSRGLFKPSAPCYTARKERCETEENGMEAKELLRVLHTAERLKDETRHCYTSGGRRESVAEHSWRIALMAFWLRDEFPQADMDKVIRMCLIHDLGECFIGDIPSFNKTDADEESEEKQLFGWVDTLPEPYLAALRRAVRDETEKKIEQR